MQNIMHLIKVLNKKINYSLLRLKKFQSQINKIHTSKYFYFDTMNKHFFHAIHEKTFFIHQ